eukprot:1160471-Pelagomonas_calceolata.AAC.4
MLSTLLPALVSLRRPQQMEKQNSFAEASRNTFIQALKVLISLQHQSFGNQEGFRCPNFPTLQAYLPRTSQSKKRGPKAWQLKERKPKMLEVREYRELDARNESPCFHSKLNQPALFACFFFQGLQRSHWRQSICFKPSLSRAATVHIVASAFIASALCCKALQEHLVGSVFASATRMNSHAPTGPGHRIQ